MTLETGVNIRKKEPEGDPRIFFCTPFRPLLFLGWSYYVLTSHTSLQRSSFTIKEEHRNLGRKDSLFSEFDLYSVVSDIQGLVSIVE